MAEINGNQCNILQTYCAEFIMQYRKGGYRNGGGSLIFREAGKNNGRKS